MSEGTTKVEEPKEEVVDVAAIKAEVDKLKSTNERLLAESKDYKTKYSALKTTVEEKTKEKLEKDEDWKSLLEQERDAKSNLANEMLKLKKQTLRKTLDFEVARYAKDAYEVEDIINSLDKDSIKIDEENLSITGVEEAINNLRNKKSYLFKKEVKAPMVEDRPGFNNPVKKTGKQTITESLTSLKQLMSEGI